ncbi:apolipoprotein N-acyltransferase [Truepera radiovictrix]|uniref:apolipoprotein N-acyltransferase n=1 Tax=Truepera radiovictrix TaxID=332249 RepID=UPI0002DAA8D9|nr:apolipoprotein N-acyltransferase [Truepera radiovictrix]
MLACGSLLSAAFPPLGLWPFVVSLGPVLLLSANAPRKRDAFWAGFFCAVGFFFLHLLWLPQSFAPYSGGLFWLLYPPLIAVLGCFWGIVTFAARALGGRGAGALWLLPALWVLMEWARTQGVFAFPWGALGYVWVGTPLVQLADLAGVYGVSLVTLVALALSVSPFAYRRPRATRGRRARQPVWRPRVGIAAALLGALALPVAGYGYGTHRLRTWDVAVDRRALLVQGSTDPYGRALELEGELELYTRLTREGVGEGPAPDLVVWPEGVTLELLASGLDLVHWGAQAVRDEIQAAAGGAPVITGGGAIDGREAFSASNSAFSLEGGNVTDRYDKVYLVPFGEFFPLIDVLTPVYRTVFGWFGYPLLQSRPPGQEIRPLTLQEVVAAAYICYESVFPQVPRTMVARGAEVLVNISNDAWFGFGGGAEQHFAMGTVRAIETRRHLLRAGNDGITAVVDPLGRVGARLPRGERGSLEVSYSAADVITPYVRFGDLLILVLGGYVALFSGARAVKAQASRTAVIVVRT